MFRIFILGSVDYTSGVSGISGREIRRLRLVSYGYGQTDFQDKAARHALEFGCSARVVALPNTYLYLAQGVLEQQPPRD
jgi:hypothetical protein